MAVLRWSLTTVRNVEAIRDRIFAMCGTDEPLIRDHEARVTMNWRKPLTIAEVAQMAQTPEVRERRGRP